MGEYDSFNLGIAVMHIDDIRRNNYWMKVMNVSAKRSFDDDGSEGRREMSVRVGIFQAHPNFATSPKI